MKRIIALSVIVLLAFCSYSFLNNSASGVTSAAYFAAIMDSTDAPAVIRSPRQSGSKYGFIDKMGHFVIPAKFDDCAEFSEDLAAIRIGHIWGFVNRSGKVVIKPQFQKAAKFSNGLSSVRKGIYWGFVDRKGEYVVPAKFQEIKTFNGVGAAAVIVGRRIALIDRTGKFLNEDLFDEIGDFSEDIAVAKMGDRFGLIDAQGHWIVKPKFEAISKCSEGLIAYCEAGKWGYLDSSGKVVLQAQFAQAGPFADGVAPAKRADGRCVLIDRQGETTFSFPPSCIGITSIPRADLRGDRERFEEGLIPMMENGKWGYASTTTGEFVIEPQFSEAGNFHQGLARVGIAPAN